MQSACSSPVVLPAGLVPVHRILAALGWDRSIVLRTWATRGGA